MHHGFTYGDDDNDDFKEEEDENPFDIEHQHQRQQQEQLQTLPVLGQQPAPSSTESPLRINLKIPPSYKFGEQRPPTASEHDDDNDFDADADADASDDFDMVNARDLPESDDRPVRRSTRHSNNSQASGSEYAQTHATGSPAETNGRALTTSSRGRTVAKVSYNEDDDVIPYGDEDEDDVGPRRPRRVGTTRSDSRRLREERDLDGFVEPDPETLRRTTRAQEKRAQERERRKNEPQRLLASDPNRGPRTRQTRNSARGRVVQSSDEYAEEDADDDDDDEDGPHSDAVHTTPSPTRPEHDAEHDEDEQPRKGRITRTRKRKSSEDDEDDGAARYPLRPRGKVDYRIPMPFEDLPFDPKDRLPPQRPRPKARAAPTVGFGPLPFPARPGDDSDSDGFTRTPRRPLAGAGGVGGQGGLFSGGAGGGMFHSDLAAAAGTPSNLGRLGAPDAAALADVDPLGVNQNVTFDDVGGLEERECPVCAVT